MRSRGGGKIREKRAVTWGFIAVKLAERFQRDFSLLKFADTARRVPTKAQEKHVAKQK